MKRRITIEVDDAVFPPACPDAPLTPSGEARMQAEVELGLLIGPMQVENQRTVAAALLSRHGVTLIADEQID